MKLSIREFVDYLLFYKLTEESSSLPVSEVSRDDEEVTARHYPTYGAYIGQTATAWEET